MYFSTGLIAVALAAGAHAIVFEFGPEGFNPQEGETVTLGVADIQGPYTVTLKNGPEGNLDTVEVLVTDSTSETFTWTPENLPSDTYALEISDGTSTNYSPQFVYSGTGEPTTSASASISTASATSTSNSTSTELTTTTSSDSTMTTMTTSSSSTSTRTPTTSSDAEETTAPVNTNGDSGSQRMGASLAFAIGAAALIALFN